MIPPRCKRLLFITSEVRATLRQGATQNDILHSNAEYTNTSATGHDTPRIETPHEIAHSFLLSLYGDRQGYAELCFVEGDPSDKNERARRAGFFAWPQQASQMLKKIEQLARFYGDVYVSSTLYADRSRNNPLATNIIVIDDAPSNPQQPYSFTVRTSQNSLHGYYLLDRIITNQERLDLGKRAAAALGGDPSGADLQQLIRVPGTINTKRGKRWPVQAEFSQAKYKPDQLAACWPAVKQSRSASVIDWPSLPNAADLLAANGLPRRLKNPYGQAYQILSSGAAPTDTSIARYIVARGLAMHGYQPSAIASLLLHFCSWNEAQKGSDWLEQDIERCIAKVLADLGSHYQPTAERTTRSGQRAASLRPKLERPKRGRPRKQTVESYLQWILDNLSASDMLFGTRKQNAEALGVSIPTVDRFEKQLREAGIIERRANKQRNDSWLVIDQWKASQFLGAIKNTSKHSKSPELKVLSPHSDLGIEKANNDVENAYRSNTPPDIHPLQADEISLDKAAETPPAAANSSPDLRLDKAAQTQPVEQAKQTEQTTQAQGASLTLGGCVPPKSLQDAVKLAIAAIPERYQALDRSTGELKPGNVTRQRVRELVRGFAGFGRLSDQVIDRALAAERKRAGYFERERIKARAATLEEVRQRSKAAAGQAAKLAKSGHPKAGFYGIVAAIWGQEESRRDEIPETEEQLLQQADAALETLVKELEPKKRAKRIKLGAAACAGDEAQSLIERLKARKLKNTTIAA